LEEVILEHITVDVTEYLGVLTQFQLLRSKKIVYWGFQVQVLSSVWFFICCRSLEIIDASVIGNLRGRSFRAQKFMVYQIKFDFRSIFRFYFSNSVSKSAVRSLVSGASRSVRNSVSASLWKFAVLTQKGACVMSFLGIQDSAFKVKLRKYGNLFVLHPKVQKVMFKTFIVRLFNPQIIIGISNRSQGLSHKKMYVCISELFHNDHFTSIFDGCLIFYEVFLW
jgi:hypothetical protein